jgi:hypothetical protein
VEAAEVEVAEAQVAMHLEIQPEVTQQNLKNQKWNQ